ncbi:hypothetical protein GTW43_37095 [Streptomyces sp. SID5785]|uniref:hypothetical protein n=1 Tax=Streptomyces sp. SID5785 TaxID=2690309 RepID=UPI0013616AE6|nr:hypothetical protein [Streptomyces sp. SID5785]MZD10655.1 hypothetical protein [Streptomyces sp. SID5785]
MAAVGVLLGVLGLFAALLCWKVARRRSTTESAEGLRIEQDSRVEAARNKYQYNALAQHNTMPNIGDYRSRK